MGLRYEVTTIPGQGSLNLQKMKKARLFIAIELPDRILKNIKEIQEKLYDCRSRVSWVRLDSIHLTIKFLGYVEEKRIEEIWTAVSKVVSSYERFRLKAEGVGCFPDMKRPRIVWVGIKEVGDKRLSSIQRGLEDGLIELGFEGEKRPFHPHLTLGRIRKIHNNEDWREKLYPFHAIECGDFEVDRIFLFKSDLRPTGTIYTKLREVYLK